MTETIALIKSLADRYGRTRDALMPILQGVVEEERYLSDVAMTEIARELDIAAAEVYGTATFYSFLDTVPRGKYVIRVCKTITCDMHGKKRVIEKIEDLLKIKLGETTQDKKFTLLTTNCLGWCHKGPVMLINNTPYPDLNEDKVTEIIMEYIRK
ncbi:MAG TPA: NAD(P)H-dependent oxidoreductase subunit E [Bacteroidales bacterium]|nr:NAD(P)H-dependent oxidoreductase subunit E [Bacteroidales bacterium]HRZ50161.1 NAD(P)H-dependent oxidoreductase subunit E [Bacteroidales bacterium]